MVSLEARSFFKISAPPFHLLADAIVLRRNV